MKTKAKKKTVKTRVAKRAVSAVNKFVAKKIVKPNIDDGIANGTISVQRLINILEGMPKTVTINGKKQATPVVIQIFGISASIKTAKLGLMCQTNSGRNDSGSYFFSPEDRLEVGLPKKRWISVAVIADSVLK